MPLFQKAPSTPEELEASRPLEISPDEVLTFDEKEWYARAYRGDGVPQLTVRAVVMGSFLGFFLAFTNLYIGLKTGWHLGVAITASILSFSIWNVFLGLGLAKTPMTILENNCMQSAASSAGYSTGGTMVSAIPALLLLSATPENPDGTHIHWAILGAWTFVLAALGCVIAIPMKRNMINQERLKFPSGTAAAVTLQSLYSKGDEALAKARALFASGVVGLLVPLLKDLRLRKVVEMKAGVATTSRHAILPDASPIFDFLPRITAGGQAYKPSDFNIALDHSLVLVAAGAIVGLRVTLSMIVGALIQTLVIGPIALDYAWTNPAGQVVRAARAPGTIWKDIGLWAGAPIMVAAGLLTFAFQWKTIVRAFRAFGPSARTGGQSTDENELVGKTEVPMRWFVIGTLFSGAAVVLIAWQFFEVPLHWGVLAVVMTFLLALVACRATGETDITPTGAMGKIMQLTYGFLSKSATANLMTAGITAGAASSSADLLNDLKSGYLLGANPRRQFIAQFAGIFSGTVATVIGWYLLVPSAKVITGVPESPGVSAVAPAFPAPAAQQWKAVAALFKDGFENLHPMARTLILVGIAVGVVLSLLELLLPRAKKYLPSATGIGLGLILPFVSSFAMFLGAVIAALVAMSDKKLADRYTVAISSGIIAGESIMGVIVAGLNNFVLTS